MHTTIKRRGTNLGTKEVFDSIALRLKSIEHYESNESQSIADTAKTFGIKLNTFKSFYRTKAKLNGHNTVDTRARARVPHHLLLEQDLIKFIKHARDNRLPVTGDVIQTKARMLRAVHNIPDDTFKASKGWLHRFVGRYGIPSVRLHGEAGQVDASSVHDAMISFCQVHAKYEPAYIYNEDESGLVYPLLPNITYLAAEKSRQEARGVKAMKSNNHIPFTMCTNADGTHVLDCMVIGKAKRPNAFDLAEPNDKVEKLYHSQTNPWMNGNLFAHYLEHIWYAAVRRRTSAAVCMNCDNCSAHGNLLPDLDGVEYAFLPSKVTSLYQLMDQGIIATVKRHARGSLLRQVMETLPHREELPSIGKQQRAGTAGLKYGYGAHILDAIRVITFGLERLTQKRIPNCWVRAGILNKKQIKKVRLACWDPAPEEFVKSPGLFAEAMQLQETENEMGSVLRDLFDTELDVVESMGGGHCQQEAAAFFENLLSETRESSTGVGFEDRSVDVAMREWISDLEEDEEMLAAGGLRDRELIIPAVDDMQTSIDTVESERVFSERAVEVVRSADVEAVQEASTYRSWCGNVEWLQQTVEEGRRRRLKPEMQAKIIDVFRLALHEERETAPQVRQTSVIDIFTRRS